MMLVRVLAASLALGACQSAQAQKAFPGDLGDFSLPTIQGQNARDWGVPSPDGHKQHDYYDSLADSGPQKEGEVASLAAERNTQDPGSGGVGGQPRRGRLPPGPPQDAFPPLDPSDRDYDPLSMPDLNRRVPSSCAEAGSTCRQCVLDAEANIQFNRRYLHVAWSVTKSHLDYADRMIRFGDTASGFHGAMALSWQLGGKPQVEEAVAQLRQTYKKKYSDYMQNIRRSLDKLAACEQDNFATQDLYAQYANLYYDMLEARYREPD